jgi:8-oxo-dGTP pyrophosphatase MutT (NUDIX family)
VIPVSVKGVVLREGRVLLLRNDRAEWELPGGRIERGEQPEDCLVREIREESGWQVTVGPILDAWVLTVGEGEVCIVTYGCHAAGAGAPQHSDEHHALGLFAPTEVEALPMPDGYKRSVAAWCQRCATAKAR